jgi:hypothetical protein
VDDLIPPEIRQFIAGSIDSIAQLEALLLLRGNAHVAWSAEAVAKRLYISEQEAAPLLGRLLDDGLLAAEGHAAGLYRYRCSSAELERLVEQLAALYARHLIPVTDLIHSKRKTRVQAFADAFKVRKQKDQ